MSEVVRSETLGDPSHWAFARVHRVLNVPGRGVLKAGDTLSGDEVRKIPGANLRALVDGKYITVEYADENLRARVAELEEKLADALAKLKR